MQSKLSYRKFVYAAYAFYLLVSLLWVIVEFYESHAVNYMALSTFIIFCIQAYYNHRIANLAMGIVLLLASIWLTLDFIAWGGKMGFDWFIITMISLGLVSIGASLVLAFSYLKMSFDNENYPL